MNKAVVIIGCAIGGTIALGATMRWLGDRDHTTSLKQSASLQEFEHENERAAKLAHTVQYKTVELPDDAGEADLVLNNRGSDGWVLVDIVRSSTPYAIFRRHEELTRIYTPDHEFGHYHEDAK